MSYDDDRRLHDLMAQHGCYDTDDEPEVEPDEDACYEAEKEKELFGD